MNCFSWNDPGPCPVDDTPHTACTPESVGTLTVTIRRPRVLDRQEEQAAAVAGPPDPPVTFTTKTYSRNVHGAAIRRQRGER